MLKVKALNRLMKLEFSFCLRRLRREPVAFFSHVYEFTITVIAAVAIGIIGWLVGLRISSTDELETIIFYTVLAQIFVAIATKTSEVTKGRFYHNFLFDWSVLGIWFTLKNLWFGILPILITWYGALLFTWQTKMDEYSVIPYITFIFLIWSINYLLKLRMYIQSKIARWFVLGIAISVSAVLGKFAMVLLFGDVYVLLVMLGCLFIIQCIYYNRLKYAFRMPVDGSQKYTERKETTHREFFYLKKDFLMF